MKTKAVKNSFAVVFLRCSAIVAAVVLVSASLTHAARATAPAIETPTPAPTVTLPGQLDPGLFAPAGLPLPDWIITSFSLERATYTWPTLNENQLYYTWDPCFYQYTIDVTNIGADLGPGAAAAALESIEFRDIAGRVFAVAVPITGQTGNSGYIACTQFPDNAYRAAMECTAAGLIAVLPGGIFGEVNTANNWAIATLPDAGGMDLDFRAGQPTLSFDSANIFEVSINPRLEGSCPDPFVHPPNLWSGLKVRVQGELVASRYDIVGFPMSGGYSTRLDGPVMLDEPLHDGDEIVVETFIHLNQPAQFFELSHNNNYSIATFTYRDSPLGPPRADLVDFEVGPVPSSATAQALSPSPFAGLFGLGSLALLAAALGVAGGFLGRSLARGLHLARNATLGVTLVSAALLSLSVTGGLLILLAHRVSNTIVTPPGLITDASKVELTSCDAYLEPASAMPANGVHIEPADQLMLGLYPTGHSLPAGADGYTLMISGPNGEVREIQWPAEKGKPITYPLDLSTFGLPHDQEASFVWGIRSGLSGQAGSGDSPTFCQGSTYHTFSVNAGGSPQAAATATSTAAAPVTIPPSLPTATFTPKPPPQDTDGPGIKKVSAAPDPIYATVPKGCKPTTSLVSAAISDPSGVASATVIFVGASAGSVPMSNTGGNQWQAKLGPFNLPGPVNYQIRAFDQLGNRSDTQFFTLTVNACIP